MHSTREIARNLIRTDIHRMKWLAVIAGCGAMLLTANLAQSIGLDKEQTSKLAQMSGLLTGAALFGYWMRQSDSTHMTLLHEAERDPPPAP